MSHFRSELPGWPYSVVAALETGRTSWTAVLDAVRSENAAGAAVEDRNTGTVGDHNTGTAEDKRAALNTIGTLTNSLITLATGTLALTVALLKNIYGHHLEWAMWLGWGLLAASIFIGVTVLGQQISLLAESDLKPRGGPLEWLGLIHIIFVVAGLVFLGFFAAKNVEVGATGGTSSVPSHRHTPSPSPTGSTPTTTGAPSSHPTR